MFALQDLHKPMHRPSYLMIRNGRIERTLKTQKEIHHDVQWLFA